MNKQQNPRNNVTWSQCYNTICWHCELWGWHILWRSITLPLCTCSSKLPEFLIPEARNILMKVTSSLPSSCKVSSSQQTALILGVSGECIRCERLVEIQVVSAEHPAPAACPHSPIGGQIPRMPEGSCWQALLWRVPLLLSTSPTWGLLGSAAKGMQRCQWGWRRSRSWQGGGGGDYSHGWVACLQQEVSVPVLQLYSPIITFTIQRQLGAHAQEVSGDHVTSAVCVPSTTPTMTPPPTFASTLYSTCHLETCSYVRRCNCAPGKLSHSLYISQKALFFLYHHFIIITWHALF